jgi:transcriptional regulator with XRE-family HTH domain
MRLAAGLGLQEFCRRAGQDAGNYSRIERGLTHPPRDHRKLEPVRAALGLDAESDDWTYLLTLADLEWGALPRRLLTDEAVRPLLPALLHGLANHPMTEQQVKALLSVIRSGR